MQRLQSYPGNELSLMCLSNKGHGLQRVYYIEHSTERVRLQPRAPWTTKRESRYVLGCACQRRAAA